MAAVPIIYRGLEGIYVKESQICFIDGEKSRLLYRGCSIEDLARHSTYEEVACLLLDGRLPSRQRLAEFSALLARARAIPEPVVRLLEDLPPSAHPMDGLRTAVSALGAWEAEKGTDRAADSQKAVRAISAVAVLAAHLHRIRSGLRPVPPREDLAHAAHFLYLLTGTPPAPEDARAMDVLFILHAEHEITASTFACMVTSSTLADLYGALTSGIGTLKGPLHGGANEDALRFILQAGSRDRAREAVEQVLARGGRIPGFGHRVYKNYDPRYRVLKEMVRDLAGKKGRSDLLAAAEAAEAHALETLAPSNIYPNVDFYSGLVMHFLGIPAELFTPIFAVGRTAGWCAHILEQRERNRIIRPKAYYTGPPARPYRPLEERA